MTQKQKSALASRLTHLIDQKWKVRANAANALGIAPANLSRYLSGKTVPTTETLIKIAEKLGLSLADLEGVGAKVSDKGAFALPNQGWVPAGKLADAATGNERTAFHEMFGGENFYTLDVRGESMTGAGIFDHDVIVVKPTSFPNRGDIVVAEVNGEKTVKLYDVLNGKPALLAFNDEFPPIILSEADDVRICGVVVGGAWERKHRRLPVKPTTAAKIKPKGKKG